MPTPMHPREDTALLRVYLRELRERRDPRLTQAALGQAVGVSDRTINGFETGERGLGMSAFWSIFRYLGGVPEHVDYLLYDRSATEEDARRLATEATRLRTDGNVPPPAAVNVTHIRLEMERQLQAMAATIRQFGETPAPAPTTNIRYLPR